MIPLTRCAPITPPPPTDHPALLPTYTARNFFFSTLLELARLPAMADFTRAAMSAFFGGDASEWERALLMPHYCAAGMPACSLHQVRILGRVIMFCQKISVRTALDGGSMCACVVACLPACSLHQVCMAPSCLV